MKIKHFLTAAALTFCFFTPSAHAETVVDFDILADTTWTLEMSPIVIKGSTRNDKIRRVANGAHLTIEAGVEVRMGAGMSFQVASQCLRGYGSDSCYRDREQNIKLPKLVARGTSTQPIVFTSDQKVPQAEDWGSVILDARENEIEWVEFRYGGARSKRAFIEVNNSLFENNLIEQGGPVKALLVSSQTLTGNVIRNNGDVGVFCDYQCEVKDNLITENGSNAIELDTVLETKITGNFLRKNKGYGILNENVLSIPVIVTDNYFLENAGGIYSHRSHEGNQFHRNNFYRNESFAIKSDTNNRVGLVYPAENNWFGIDTGARSGLGQYFVSADYDVSTFVADGYDFALSGASRAARTYRDYLSQNNLTDAFFEAKVERRVIIGSENSPGSLLRYAVTLKNLTTKAVDNIKLNVSTPGDQIILLCSVQPATAGFDYSLTNACTTALPGGITFQFSQLKWSPSAIAAMQEQTLFFATALKPDAVGIATLPQLRFDSGEGKERPFAYTLGNATTLQRSGAASTSSPAPTQPAVATPAPQPVSAPVVAPTPAPVAEGALAVGTVSRQIINGVLSYVLSTADGKHYSLLNKWKWREIDDFTKGADKNKTIAVYGEFYVNRYGVKTGIKFTRFEIR